jgi:hypothetical protein
MQVLLALIAALVVGASSGEVGLQDRSAAERPSGPPPPTVGGYVPPPAWVETERGSFWLSHSGFCWGNRCVKMAGRLGPGALPPVLVRKGDVVRFHLGFRARRVLLSVGRRDAVRLRPGRTTSWRVEQGGVVSLYAYAARGGSAGYFAVFKQA